MTAKNLKNDAYQMKFSYGEGEGGGGCLGSLIANMILFSENSSWWPQDEGRNFEKKFHDLKIGIWRI